MCAHTTRTRWISAGAAVPCCFARSNGRYSIVGAHRLSVRRSLRLAAAALALLPAAGRAAVPRAQCRPTDRVESGMQGETTRAEVESGANQRGFACNVDLVGAVQGEGASWVLSAWKTCAYYDQAASAALAHAGVVVVDASDPAHPTISDHLTAPAMIDPWESLKVNGARQLLAGAQHVAPGFAIYDLSGDCRHPQVRASLDIPGSLGHTGEWAPGGNTFYITTILPNPSIVAVDTSDPSHPRSLAQWTPPPDVNPTFHDMALSADGNTAYVALDENPPFTPLLGNGVAILDVSDVQQRRPNPTFRIVSVTTWHDGGRAAQYPLPFRVADRPYLLVTDEGGEALEGVAAAQAGCAAGLHPNGPPRILDIADPAAPKLVSKLEKETDDPANCPAILSMIPLTAAGTQWFGTSCHYCNVDDPSDAKIAACSCFAAGWRFYDIRDPVHPREIAYYKAPAQGTKALPGSQYPPLAGAGFPRPVDWAPSKASFPKDRGMASGDVWVTTMDNGFQVLHLDLPADAPPPGGTPTPSAPGPPSGSPGPPAPAPRDGGGCSSSGAPAGTAALAMAAALLLARRRPVRPNSTR